MWFISPAEKRRERLLAHRSTRAPSSFRGHPGLPCLVPRDLGCSTMERSIWWAAAVMEDVCRVFAIAMLSSLAWAATVWEKSSSIGPMTALYSFKDPWYWKALWRNRRTPSKPLFAFSYPPPFRFRWIKCKSANGISSTRRSLPSRAPPRMFSENTIPPSPLRFKLLSRSLSLSIAWREPRNSPSFLRFLKRKLRSSSPKRFLLSLRWGLKAPAMYRRSDSFCRKTRTIGDVTMDRGPRLRVMWTVADLALPSVRRESTASHSLTAVMDSLARTMCVCLLVGVRFLCESRCGIRNPKHCIVGDRNLYRDSHCGSCGLFQDSETLCLGVFENEFSLCINMLFTQFNSIQFNSNHFCFIALLAFVVNTTILFTNPINSLISLLVVTHLPLSYSLKLRTHVLANATVFNLPSTHNATMYSTRHTVLLLNVKLRKRIF